MMRAADGRAKLSGAELELMNLAGPRTGLEMMTPVGSRMPTPNFFSEGGYSRNPVVHNKTGAELLATLDSAHGIPREEAGLDRVRPALRRGRAPLRRLGSLTPPGVRPSDPATPPATRA